MYLFVWDFHGVMEIGNEKAVLEFSNHILKENGFKERFAMYDIHLLNGLEWIDYFKHLLPNLTQKKHQELNDAVLKHSFDNLDRVEELIGPNHHLHDVLKAIKKAGHDQIVVSNTQREALPFFLRSVKATKFFPKGKAFATHDEKTKFEIVEHYLKDKNYEKVFVIGDSQSDIHLARDVKAVAVAYIHPGFKQRIHGGDFLINDLRELLRIAGL